MYKAFHSNNDSYNDKYCYNINILWLYINMKFLIGTEAVKIMIDDESRLKQLNKCTLYLLEYDDIYNSVYQEFGFLRSSRD